MEYDEAKEKKKTCSRGCLTVLVAYKKALQRKPQQGSVGEGGKEELLFLPISNPLTATCKCKSSDGQKIPDSHFVHK